MSLIHIYLGMLAAVETAVAMGNAMPEVKAVADYVTDDVAPVSYTHLDVYKRQAPALCM